MSNNVGYFAQRSSNPNKVLAFFKKYPEAAKALGSGVNTSLNITRKELKHFGITSPKLSTVLICLGVSTRVVEHYFSTNVAQSKLCHIYFMSNFPYPEILRQQSDSIHFSTCMSSGIRGADEKGANYQHYIDGDIKDYTAGNLGLWVIGNPYIDVFDVHGRCVLDGDYEGFVARAKLRLLYNEDRSEILYLLIEPCYPSSCLLSRHLPALADWVLTNLGSHVKLITKKSEFKNLKNVTDVPAKTRVWTTISGYQDTLGASYESTQELSTKYLQVLDTPIRCKSLQVLAFEEKKKANISVSGVCLDSTGLRVAKLANEKNSFSRSHYYYESLDRLMFDVSRKKIYGVVKAFLLSRLQSTSKFKYHNLSVGYFSESNNRLRLSFGLEIKTVEPDKHNYIVYVAIEECPATQVSDVIRYKVRIESCRDEKQIQQLMTLSLDALNALRKGLKKRKPTAQHVKRILEWDEWALAELEVTYS